MVGFLLVDKPAGITSHDVVDAVRHLTHEKRVGHAGTLDPFATGLLIVGVGREATREFQKLVGLDKEYEATMMLGATSDTQDLTGRIEAAGVRPQVTADELDAVLRKFVGPQRQTPPMYSAKKMGGKKLYELAREGKEVAREPVDIVIRSLEALSFEPPHASFRVTCSSGTYVRTLAHDIGRALGCGAYLTALRRTAIGPFSIKEAVPLPSLTKEDVAGRLLPVADILGRR